MQDIDQTKLGFIRKPLVYILVLIHVAVSRTVLLIAEFVANQALESWEMNDKKIGAHWECLPCPFCGNVAIAEFSVRWRGIFTSPQVEHAARCQDCGASGPKRETGYLADALEAWNKRGGVS